MLFRSERIDELIPRDEEAALLWRARLVPTRLLIGARNEILRLRAENDHLRRVGMGRPSAELHEAALSELRAENERLRALIAELDKESKP